MAAPFAWLEQRVNRALHKHLTNAIATWTPAGGGDSVDTAVIFDRARGEVDENGVVVHQPTLDLLDVAAWPAVREGDDITIDGASYVVRSVVPDGDGGLLTITLARR